MIGARVTITDINIDRQIEMVDYFYNLGIRYVWTNPLFYSVGKIPVCLDEQKKQSYHFDMDLYIDNYLEAYRYSEWGNNNKKYWSSWVKSSPSFADVPQTFGTFLRKYDKQCLLSYVSGGTGESIRRCGKCAGFQQKQRAESFLTFDP